MKGPKEVDPLSLAMRPPPDETSSERAEREAREREAKLISDGIDAEIELERKKKRSDNSVKVLLLGQSESGKSTTLKQFQLIFASKQFQKEKISWKLVVQLNVVRSIRIILEQLSSLTTTKPIPFEDNKVSRTIHPFSHLNGSSGTNGSTSSLAISSHSSGRSSDSDLPSTTASIAHSNPKTYPRSLNSPISPVQRSPTSPFPWPLPVPPPTSPALPAEMPKLSDHHRTLRMRLLPLLHLEASLLRRLNPSGDDEATQRSGNWPSGGRELFVRSSVNWKEKVTRLRNRGLEMRDSFGQESTDEDHDDVDFDNPEDPSHVIQVCKHDMLALWHDPVVRQVLRIGNVRLEEMPGFFLDDIERIAAPGYMPSDDDVLRARLKTVGVSEYNYTVSIFGEKMSWVFYDVGGARTQRPAWQSYFSHVDALIFLAPISAFDQVLVEDGRVNRIEDSLLLFKSICRSELLKDVDVILFLNKIDILKAKLESGIKVSKYIKSYGEKPNEFEPVTKFFRNKFAAVYREYTPRSSKKMFYIHMTKVTETDAMRGILTSVCDAIFRSNLASNNLA